MYYSEFLRIRRVEKILESLAYFSILLDMLVAIATFLTVNGQASTTILFLSDYLLLFEVILAAVIFALLISLKHYRSILDSFSMMIFRTRYKRQSALFR